MGTKRAAGSGYMYAQARAGEAERERLALVEATWDPHTIRHLESIGVGEGWRCIDVGAGGGSIASWLSERVGPAGRVVAADLELESLRHLKNANIDVVRHDIVSEELPREGFDLVHTRLLLMHLANPDEALKRIVGAVKPGGWVLVGDADVRVIAPARPSNLFTRVRDAWLAAMTSGGADVGYGEKIPVALEAQGLIDVQAESIPWGANTRSRCDLVFVKQPTEPVSATYGRRLRRPQVRCPR